MHYIEIRTPPDQNGNVKRIYILLDGQGLQESVTRCDTGFNAHHRISLALFVTPGEFKQYDNLAKAQAAK